MTNKNESYPFKLNTNGILLKAPTSKFTDPTIYN